MSEFELLKIIPGVHASIIGIFIAFFSAYFFFVYQKLTEAQENIDSFIKKLERPVFNNYFYMLSEPDFQHYQDYQTVYEKFKSNFEKIDDLSLTISYLDISDDVTQPNDEEKKEISSIEKQLNDAWSHYDNTIYYLYYGFGLIPPLTDFDSNQYLNNSEKFKLYSELIETYSSRYRINDLIECSDTFNDIYKKFKINEELIHFEKYRKTAGKDFEMLKARVLEPYKNQSNRIKYHFCAENINNLMDFYNHQYPEIIYRINKLKKIHETFKLKKYFRVCLSLFLVVMIFGILSPLFIIKSLAQCDLIFFNEFYITSSVVENIIVLISFAPYIGICLYSFFKFGFKKPE
ncbi:hypothetical protein [Acinetobacter lwoffii]|uniref:hypothetical protein n=1 Tax=Acinetobacter lwoffii TaxID=28090 RepID=UPI00168CDE1B|nr:hypothetical protein [Acinetobacter lwoffii]